MFKHIFWEHVDSNWEIALLIGIGSIIFHFGIFRKYIYSVFDPYFLSLLMGSMAHAVPVFLYVNGLISSYYFSTFVLSQAAYIVGFLLIEPVDLRKTRLFASGVISVPPVVETLYKSSLFCLVLCQLAVYYSSGIPLLMHSRLEIFAGGGGYGILNRFLAVCHPIVTVIAMYKLAGYFLCRLSISRIDKFAVFFVALISCLSGSKATLLLIVFAAFFVRFFLHKFSDYNHEAEKKIKRLQAILVALSIFLALAVIVVQSDGFSNPLGSLLMRIVNTGDVYMLAYPENVLSVMKPANPFLATFQDLLGASRIFSWSELPQNLGQQLYQYVNQSTRIAGPNSRHNVFGLHYFGPYFSVVLSFMLGFTCSFLRNKLFTLMRPTLQNLIVYSLIVPIALELETDTPLFFADINSILLIFGFLYSFSFFAKRFSDVILRRVTPFPQKQS